VLSEGRNQSNGKLSESRKVEEVLQQRNRRTSATAYDMLHGCSMGWLE